jgi:hypothetical protein
MSVHIIHDTKGAGVAALAERLKRLAAGQVLVGVPAGKSEPDGTSMAEVAAINEFGTADGRIPERAPLRGGMKSGEAKLKGLSERLAKGVAEDRLGPDQALEMLGASAAGEVKLYMASGEMKASHPNAPSTIAKKGSDQPTVDSGSLRQSITHKVEFGGGGT